MRNTPSLGKDVNANTYNGGPRDEITNVQLNVIKGTLPNDLHGVVFYGSMCGSVNSGGLPFPRNLPNGESNPEFGTPFVNGDGMVFSMNMETPGKVFVSSRLMKTPSFYADQATGNDGPARNIEAYKHFKYENHGLSRMSPFLGARNYVNTALIPVAFDNDSAPALITTIDNGRPFKLDPTTLELITPLGYNKEWTSAMPPFLKMPFPMFSTSAHPSYDAVTKELFSVNYTQSMETDLAHSILGELLRKDKAGFEKELTDIAHRHQKHQNAEKSIQEIKDMMSKAKKERSAKKNNASILGFILDFLASFFKDKLENESSTIDQVHLLRFNNKGSLKKWQLVDEQGKNLVIDQCMHQTSLSENYILLMDSSFKFAFELLVSNPFPNNPEVERLIRAILGKTMEPYTDMWIVNRKDINEDSDTIKAVKLKGNIPFECIHFSTEYDDSQNQITIYTAHNNAACFAEWIREIDTNYFNKDNYPDSLVGDFATGEMSVGALGKFVIDPQKGIIIEEKILREVGKKLPPPNELPPGTGPIKNVGANTWGIGLYTYREMISPTIPNRKIEKLFFINYGTNPTYLTNWIYDLYEDYKNRDIPLNDFKAYSERGIPPSLIVVDTATMEFTNHYEFRMNSHPMTVQFVPRKEPTPNIPEAVDGYLLLTVKSPLLSGSEIIYQSQLWIMDANNVGAGPICILEQEDFKFCFTSHSTWLPQTSIVKSGYQVDIRQDYEQTIDEALLFFEEEEYKSFFNTYIYPHFEKKSTEV